MGLFMVYCQKCGTKNDDDATFCKKCGNDLAAPRRYHHRNNECEDRCGDDECSDKRHPGAWSNFWMIILALIAIGIVISLLTRLFPSDLPNWFRNFEFWDIIPLLIGLVIVLFIIYMVSRPKHRD